jgi:hypothetical protein
MTTRTRRPRRSFCPAVDSLEDRTGPATHLVVSGITSATTGVT